VWKAFGSRRFRNVRLSMPNAWSLPTDLPDDMACVTRTSRLLRPVEFRREPHVGPARTPAASPGIGNADPPASAGGFLTVVRAPEGQEVARQAKVSQHRVSSSARSRRHLADVDIKLGKGNFNAFGMESLVNNRVQLTDCCQPVIEARQIKPHHKVQS